MPPRLWPPSCRLRIDPNHLLPCRHFHTGPISLLPNPYSKRPAELPQPADIAPRPPKTDRKHGLYGFFHMKKSLGKYQDVDGDPLHGRPWTAEELRQKSWNDLHILWYKCVMERNIIATGRFEARKQKLDWYYNGKHAQREATVKRTMARIKFVLWERYRAWWGAFQLNEQDPLLLDRIKLEEEEAARKAEQEMLSRMTAKQRARDAKLREAREREREVQRKREEEREKAMKELEELKELQKQEDARLMTQFQEMASGDGKKK